MNIKRHNLNFSRSSNNINNAKIYYWREENELQPLGIPESERDEFEKIRLEYSKYLYEHEQLTKERIERKSRFYLSIITILLSATFLKIDFFSSLSKIIQQQGINNIFTFAIYASGVTLAITTSLTLISILQTYSIF